jgi:DNA-binding NarL/FixJ family response regulator
MQPAAISKSALPVLIVDDHSLLREGLSLMLQNCSEFTVTGAAYQDAISAVKRDKPDVVVLGLGAMQAEFWSTVKSLCELGRNANLLIIDEAVRTRNIRLALSLGIRGYWTKHASFSQIEHAVRQMAEGKGSFCPEVEQCLRRTGHELHYHPAHTDNPLETLTPRESELFALLASGLSVKKCSQRMNISVNTADNHKTRLMRKLGVHKCVDLARLALQEGLIME